MSEKCLHWNVRNSSVKSGIWNRCDSSDCLNSNESDRCSNVIASNWPLRRLQLHWPRLKSNASPWNINDIDAVNLAKRMVMIMNHRQPLRHRHVIMISKIMTLPMKFHTRILTSQTMLNHTLTHLQQTICMQPPSMSNYQRMKSQNDRCCHGFCLAKQNPNKLHQFQGAKRFCEHESMTVAQFRFDALFSLNHRWSGIKCSNCIHTNGNK